MTTALLHQFFTELTLLQMLNFYLLFFFPKLFVCLCKMFFFSCKSSVFRFQTLKWMHFFFSIPVETRQTELLTALHFVLNLHLNAARKGSHLFVHLLALINRGCVFRMFTLLLRTCAYLLYQQMALTLQNAHQKKKRRRRRRHSTGN